jgi:hypothetical protein
MSSVYPAIALTHVRGALYRTHRGAQKPFHKSRSPKSLALPPDSPAFPPHSTNCNGGCLAPTRTRANIAPTAQSSPPRDRRPRQAGQRLAMPWLMPRIVASRFENNRSARRRARPDCRHIPVLLYWLALVHIEERHPLSLFQKTRSVKETARSPALSPRGM